MGFTEVLDLECDTTVSLGGRNKKTGKANPSQVEGYYLGSKQVPSKMSKTGTCALHIFQTEKGKVGVWGKTDLDRKLANVAVGTMTRATQSGTKPTPFGEMYKFKVEVDGANTIEVNYSSQAESNVENEDEGGYEAADDEAEEIFDEVPPVPTARPTKPASTPDAARLARTQALLSGNKSTK